MGRTCQTQPPLDIAVVQQAFVIRQEDGQLVRRGCHVAVLAHEPATFRGPGGKLLVRVYVNGKIRRVVAGRIAWALATGQWPHGVVKARDGNERDLRPANLILVKRGVNPFAIGKSSLKRRAEVDSTLLKTLAANPGSTLPQLSELIGATTSCCCTRLGGLEKRGLTCSPKCQARLRWDLTERGRELAAAADPVVIDDLDQQVLGALSVTPMGVVKLARRIGVCQMTIRRRARLLAERGLVFADERRFYVISDQGRQALGADDAPRPAPWLRPEQISASSARDVLKRMEHPHDDRSAAQRSAHATLAAAKAVETQKLHKRERQRFAFGEFGMTG